MQDLQYRLDKYTGCMRVCSSELAENIWMGGNEIALETIGVMEKMLTTDKTLIRVMVLQAYATRVYNIAGETIDAHGVCARGCDKLYQDIVELGRAGLLGAAVGGDISHIEEVTPELLDTWLRNVKPIDPSELPWQFHNDLKWDEINRTG